MAEAAFGIRVPDGDPGALEGAAGDLRMGSGAFERSAATLRDSSTAPWWTGTASLTFADRCVSHADAIAAGGELMHMAAGIVNRLAAELESAKRATKAALDDAKQADSRRETAETELRQARSRELAAADRLSENAELLREAVGRFPDDAVVLLTAAAATFAVDSPDEAKRYVRRAAELARDDPGRLTWAASLMLNLRELGEAKDLAVRAAEIAPDDFEFTGDLSFVMGRVALAFEQEEAAERALRSAFELEPARPGRGELLAHVLQRTGRPTEALEVLGEALRHRPDDEELTRLRDRVLGAFQGEATGARLQSVLRALRAGRASAHDVRDALHGADVYVPHSGAQDETDVTLSTIRGDNGEAIPLFSSTDTMAAALGPDHAHLQVPFTALVSGWPEGVDAIVDPGSEWALRLPAHTLTRPH